MSSIKKLIKFSFLKKYIKNWVYMLYGRVCYKGTFETHTHFYRVYRVYINYCGFLRNCKLLDVNGSKNCLLMTV